MKILLTGANGFVGQRIMYTYPEIMIPSPSLRGMEEETMRRMILESGAGAIIHTAAISSIPECEEHPEESYTANVRIPEAMAKICARENIKLVCFSSDQVYSGSDAPGPYKEGDTAPSNIYSVHKLEMERRVLDICPDAVMLRAEMMYDYLSKKPNFFTRIMDKTQPLSFSSGQYRGIAYLGEVAREVIRTVELPGGPYNFGCETELSMYEIMKEFFAFTGSALPLEDGPARHNLWMDCSKAASGGIHFSSAIDGLKQCFTDFQAS